MELLDNLLSVHNGLLIERTAKLAAGREEEARELNTAARNMIKDLWRAALNEGAILEWDVAPDNKTLILIGRRMH